MITEETVRKVAKIARLGLTGSETAQFAKDMEGILAAFDNLKAVETDRVEPSFQPLDIKNAMREDREEPCLSQEEALANTGNKERGYFRGPKVM